MKLKDIIRQYPNIEKENIEIYRMKDKAFHEICEDDLIWVEDTETIIDHYSDLEVIDYDLMSVEEYETFFCYGGADEPTLVIILAYNTSPYTIVWRKNGETGTCDIQPICEDNELDAFRIFYERELENTADYRVYFDGEVLQPDVGEDDYIIYGHDVYHHRTFTVHHDGGVTEYTAIKQWHDGE